MQKSSCIQRGTSARLRLWLSVLSLSVACTAEVDDAESIASHEQPLTNYTVTFATHDTGQFLCAENGGGGPLSANRNAAQAWEHFTLIDRNDGDLMSGDLVYLRAANGQYVQAVNGGGGAVNAASPNQLDWETFRIVKRGGSGRIVSGDVVGLQTLVSGRWVQAVNGGGGGVNANGASLENWEAFRIGIAEAPPRLIWHDEFDGPEIDETKWAYEVKPPGWVNNELQNYTYRRRENARIENGMLVIEGHRDWFQGHEYSSARLKTQGKASFTYGRIEARIQVPWGWGTWPAFWMMPDDFSRGWPACGELDILEHVGHDPNVVHGTAHARAYNWQSSEQRTASTHVPGATSGFHVYAIEWRPDRIDWFVDGRRYYTLTNPNRGDDWWPFNKSFYIILNLAIGGSWGGARGVDPNTWPQRMLVDYVRVYAL